MFPILFSLGPIKVYSFGVFLFLAVLFGSFVVFRESQKFRLDEEEIFDFLFFEGFFATVFGRIYYIIFHFERFSQINPFYWVLLFHFPGLSFLGAVLGMIFGLWLFGKFRKADFWRLGDLGVLGLSIGEGIGRLGAFFSGSSFGIETKLPWGVPMIGLLGKRHPVQIYESIIFFTIFIVLIKLKEILKEKKVISGIIFLVYFAVFGFFKFFLEFLKAESAVAGKFRIDQIFYLLTFFLSVILIYRRLGRSVRMDIIKIIEKAKSQKLEGKIAS